MTADSWRCTSTGGVPASNVESDKWTLHKRFDEIFVPDLTAEVNPLDLLESIDGLLLTGGRLVVSISNDAGFMQRSLRRQCEIRGYETLSTNHSSEENTETHTFRRTDKAPRWVLRNARSSSYAGIANLFENVFGYPLSRELWQWKYGNGRGNAILALSGSNVVAHYGGIYRDVLIAGKPDRVAQIADVMVHPNERGVLTRNGPFFLVGSSWPEIYGPKGFGFPTARAMQVAVKMGLYKEAGKMVEVQWSPSRAGPRLGQRLKAINVNTPELENVVNKLWREMATDLAENVVGVRSWNYFQHRYLQHPHNCYQAFLLQSRWQAKPLGIFVVRTVDRRCELLDVIAPLKNLGTVLSQARRIAERHAALQLYCWITDNCKSAFLDHEGKEVELDLRVPASSWTAQPCSELFVGKWWLMSGDTDFR